MQGKEKGTECSGGGCLFGLGFVSRDSNVIYEEWEGKGRELRGKLLIDVYVISGCEGGTGKDPGLRERVGLRLCAPEDAFRS